MDKIYICPSLMCADQLRLYDGIKALEEAGADLLHIDVMDGCFVPNIQLGTSLIEAIRAEFDIPLDFHLMIESPGDKLGFFPIREGDWVSVHYETDRHPARTAAKITALGAKPLLALDPETPLSVCEDIIDCFEGLLIMTVDPGYAGQKLIPAAVGKIKRARDAFGGGIIIEADGNVSFENAEKMKAAGANALVCGLSSLFSGEYSLKEAAEILRRTI